ncbi:MAG TPA: cupredoxin domain-containing protein [Terracidiphilus sp.]|jgi:cytochrome c oxidase subunit 2
MKRRPVQLFLMLGVMMAGILSGPMVWAHDAPQRIEITAKRFTFDPGEITLKKGQPVVLVIRSADVAHGLRFRDLNVDVKVKAGGTTEVEFTPRTAGDFIGHCSVFCGSGHGTMTLKLHVVD